MLLVQRLIARVAAVVVLAIAKDDHGAAEFVARLILHQLVRGAVIELRQIP